MPPETQTNGDDELLEALRTRLYTGVVSDILDRQGLLDQAMAARIRPIERTMRLVGGPHRAHRRRLSAAGEPLRQGDCRG